MHTQHNPQTGFHRYADSFDGIRVSFETKATLDDSTARVILLTKAHRIRQSIQRNIREGMASTFRHHAGAFGVGRVRV